MGALTNIQFNLGLVVQPQKHSPLLPFAPFMLLLFAVRMSSDHKPPFLRILLTELTDGIVFGSQMRWLNS